MIAKKISVMVVDDHALLLAGLCMLLDAEADMRVVGRTSSAGEAVSLAGQLRPDVILLDISLGDTSGLDLLTTLQEQAPASRIMMLTMHEDQQYLRLAMARGAAGFILKKGLDVDLLYAIRSVMRGEIFIQPFMVQQYLTGQAAASTTSGTEDKDSLLWATLSPRERQVMLAVAQGHTSKEIAQQEYLSEKTVATYRSRAMIKLGLDTKAELVELTLRLGVLAKERPA